MKKNILFLLILLPMLQACVPAAVVAGGAFGAVVVSDNRSIKTMWQDRNISYQAQKLINRDSELRSKTHISVATFNHVVLLVGQAPTPALRTRAVALVKSLTGLKIRRIYNQITIGAPSSMLTRSSDTVITGKVKAKMIAMFVKENLKFTQMKVVTENGTVYLLGLTTPSQAALAVATARKVSGVQKVVKVFEYK